jgi:hypothetical protein
MHKLTKDKKVSDIGISYEDLQRLKHHTAVIITKFKDILSE